MAVPFEVTLTSGRGGLLSVLRGVETYVYEADGGVLGDELTVYADPALSEPLDQPFVSDEQTGRVEGWVAGAVNYAVQAPSIIGFGTRFFSAGPGERGPQGIPGEIDEGSGVSLADIQVQRESPLNIEYPEFASQKVGDDWGPAIQAAIDQAATGVGSSGAIANRVLIPPGEYRVDSPITVKQKVAVQMGGRSVTRLYTTESSLPGGAPLFTLGTPGELYAFNCRLEGAEISAPNLTAPVVYSDNVNEQCGLRFVAISHGPGGGIHIEHTETGAPQHFSIIESEVVYFGGSDSGLVGVDIDCSGGMVYMDRVSVVSDLTTQKIGKNVLIRRGYGMVSRLHVEGATYGLQLGSDADSQQTSGIVVAALTGPSAYNSIGSLLRLEEDAQGLTASGLVKDLASKCIDLHTDFKTALACTSAEYTALENALVGDLAMGNGTANARSVYSHVSGAPKRAPYRSFSYLSGASAPNLSSFVEIDATANQYKLCFKNGAGTIIPLHS